MQIQNPSNLLYHNVEVRNTHMSSPTHQNARPKMRGGFSIRFFFIFIHMNVYVKFAYVCFVYSPLFNTHFPVFCL